MKVIALLLLVLGYVIASVAEAKSYAPIGSSLGNSNTMVGSFIPAKVSDRPFLPGMRPVELELLEDALRRKMHITIGDSRAKAHQKIIRNAMREPMKRSHMVGYLAEARFLEKNPGWAYVKSSTASQHDVYTWHPNRKPPFTAQIKTHASGNPLTYADDMLKDHLSNWFVVPDDHVLALRKHWSDKLREYEVAGRAPDAVEARRQLARIRGLGDTYKGLDNGYSRAARFALREQYAGYISIGAAAAMILGPLLWDLSHPGSVTDQTVLRTAHGLSILAAERVASYSLSRNASSIASSESASGSAVSKFGSGALQGGLRGNAIVAIAILATDTGFSIYEHGGRQAFQNEAFYANFGGSVWGLPMGLYAGLIAGEVTGNPIAGAVAGTAVGTVGYLGGRFTTRKILETINPEFLHKEENSAFTSAKEQVGNKIKELQRSRV
jgi:hypothetical protein